MKKQMFFVGIVLAVASLLFSLNVLAGVERGLSETGTAVNGSTTPGKGDGRLILYSYHTGDVLEVTYRDAKGYDKAALDKINHVMRCRGDDKIFPISPKLVDLLDKIQDHFGAETIEIISGYRSGAFNEYLIDNGRGAASESLHKQGLAADIHIDEVTEKELWEYVKSLGMGGAGYYPQYNFVHVDVGAPRTWSEAEPKQRILIGVDQSPNKGWSVATDKNIYMPGEPVSFAITNELPDSSALIKNFWYERFRKGKWAEHKIIEKSKDGGKLKTGETFTYTWNAGELPYGKYRIAVFTSRNFNVPPAYSNEFFVKK